MMGAGKSLREKHYRVIQSKPEEHGSWHVRSRRFQWGKEHREVKAGGVGREEETSPKLKYIEEHQRNQQQSTPIPKWCCQELVNTKSARCVVSCLGPDSLYQVTDGIREWLLFTTESV